MDADGATRGFGAGWRPSKGHLAKCLDHLGTLLYVLLTACLASWLSAAVVNGVRTAKFEVGFEGPASASVSCRRVHQDETYSCQSLFPVGTVVYSLLGDVQCCYLQPIECQDAWSDQELCRSYSLRTTWDLFVAGSWNSVYGTRINWISTRPLLSNTTDNDKPFVSPVFDRSSDLSWPSALHTGVLVLLAMLMHLHIRSLCSNDGQANNMNAARKWKMMLRKPIIKDKGPKANCADSKEFVKDVVETVNSQGTEAEKKALREILKQKTSPNGLLNNNAILFCEDGYLIPDVELEWESEFDDYSEVKETKTEEHLTPPTPDCNPEATPKPKTMIPFKRQIAAAGQQVSTNHLNRCRQWKRLSKRNARRWFMSVSQALALFTGCLLCGLFVETSKAEPLGLQHQADSIHTIVAIPHEDWSAKTWVENLTKYLASSQGQALSEEAKNLISNAIFRLKTILVTTRSMTQANNEAEVIRTLPHFITNLDFSILDIEKRLKEVEAQKTVSQSSSASPTLIPETSSRRPIVSGNHLDAEAFLAKYGVEPLPVEVLAMYDNFKGIDRPNHWDVGLNDRNEHDIESHFTKRNHINVTKASTTNYQGKKAHLMTNSEKLHSAFQLYPDHTHRPISNLKDLILDCQMVADLKQSRVGMYFDLTPGNPCVMTKEPAQCNTACTEFETNADKLIEEGKAGYSEWLEILVTSIASCKQTPKECDLMDLCHAVRLKAPTDLVSKLIKDLNLPQPEPILEPPNMYVEYGVFDSGYILLNGKMYDNFYGEMKITEQKVNFTGTNSPIGFTGPCTSRCPSLCAMSDRFEKGCLIIGFESGRFKFQNEGTCGKEELQIRTVNLEKSSCKLGWEMIEVVFQPREQYFYQIVPWLGFVKSYWKEEKVEGAPTLLAKVLMWSKQPKSEALTVGVYGFHMDLNKLPRDSCGCTAQQNCYRKGNAVIRKGHSLYKSDRQLPLVEHKVIETSESFPDWMKSTSQMLADSTGFTTSGVYQTYRKKYITPEYIILSADLFDYEANNLRIRPSQEWKKGVFTAPLTMEKKKDNLLQPMTRHDRVTLRVLTQVGTFSIDQCGSLQKDGSEESARQRQNCELKTTDSERYAQYVLLTLVCTLVFCLIIHYFRMIFPFHSNKYRCWSYCISSQLLCKRRITNERWELPSLKATGKIDFCEVWTSMVEAKRKNNYLAMSVSWFPPLIMVILGVLFFPWLIAGLLTLIQLPLLMCRREVFFGAKDMRYFDGPMWLLFPQSTPKPISKSLVKANRYRVSMTFVIVISTWAIMISGLVSAVQAGESSGQAINMIETCHEGICKEKVMIIGSLDASKSYSVTHPLLRNSVVVGSTTITVSDFKYVHPLVYDFTTPHFDTNCLRIICKTEDADRSESCWSRYNSCADPDENQCDTTGSGRDNFLDAAGTNALSAAYVCQTFSPKGYWYGGGSPPDGFEWVGLKYQTDFTKTGRRKWVVGTVSMKGMVKIEVMVDQNKLLNVEKEIDRYLDTVTFDEHEGSARIIERRISGRGVEGDSMFCSYQKMNEHTSPVCKMMDSAFEDENNFNIRGEPIYVDGVMVGGFEANNRISFVRTASADVGIAYRDHNQDDVNFFGNHPNFNDITGCQVKIIPGDAVGPKKFAKCTDPTFKEENVCRENLGQWVQGETYTPSANMELDFCTSVKLDYVIDLNLEVSGDSGVIKGVDVYQIVVEIDGCWGANGMVQVSLASRTDEEGLIFIHTSSTYVSCPTSHQMHRESQSFNCTSSIDKFTLEISSFKSGTSDKATKTFASGPLTACKTYTFDPYCDGCEEAPLLLPPSSLSWWEILLIVLGSVAGILVLFLIFACCVPYISVIRSGAKQKES